MTDAGSPLAVRLNIGHDDVTQVQACDRDQGAGHEAPADAS
jgi:hypothetical protein